MAFDRTLLSTINLPRRRSGEALENGKKKETVMNYKKKKINTSKFHLFVQMTVYVSI